MLVVAVGAGEGPENLEFFVKKVVSVTSIRYAIVHNELLEHLNSGITVKRQIFTVAIDDFAMFL